MTAVRETAPDGQPVHRPRSASGRALVLLTVVAAVVAWPLLGRFAPDALDRLDAAIRRTGPWIAPTVLAMTAAGVALGAPRQLVALLAGRWLGWTTGGCMTYLGAVLGCAAAFWCARRWGHARVRRSLGARAARLDGLVGEHGLVITLLMRVAPVGNCQFTNLALGMSSVRGRDFLVGTAIGILPSTLAFALLGGATQESPTTRIVSASVLLLASCGLVLAFRRHANRLREVTREVSGGTARAVTRLRAALAPRARSDRATRTSSTRPAG